MTARTELEHAERMVLAALLTDPESLPLVKTEIGVDHFHNEDNRMIFAAMELRYEIEYYFDPVSIAAEVFKAMPDALTKLLRLKDELPPTVNVYLYVKQLKDRTD